MAPSLIERRARKIYMSPARSCEDELKQVATNRACIPRVGRQGERGDSVSAYLHAKEEG